MLDTIGKYNVAFHRVNDIDDKNCCCWSSILWNCQCCQQWSLESMELSVKALSHSTVISQRPLCVLWHRRKLRIQYSLDSLITLSLRPYVFPVWSSVCSQWASTALCVLSVRPSPSQYVDKGHHVSVQLAHSACLWLWWRADAHWLCIDDEAAFIPKCVCGCAPSSSWRPSPFLDSSTVSWVGAKP